MNSWRENAAYWIREFHFDGLRLDATQQIFDASPEHIVAALTRSAREAAPDRCVVVVAENETQDSRIVRPRSAGGYGLDAIWNDDFHHSARVALTGREEAYYSDYAGCARELLACAKHGFLYQGQRSSWQKKPRGSPSLDIDRQHCITFLENHDQVANSGRGRRLVSLTSPGMLRAMTAVLLLGPGTPMLFQGQEWASATPFLYFADHQPALAEAVAKGRREFLLQFPSLAKAELDPPGAEETFRKCALDWSARERHPEALALHRDLIALRRADPVLRTQGRDGLDGATLSENAFFLRFFDPQGRDRLLIVNLGLDLKPSIVPEPLLAPPRNASWRLLWSSEDFAYGGDGMSEPQAKDGQWFFPGHAAVVMAAGA